MKKLQLGTLIIASAILTTQAQAGIRDFSRSAIDQGAEIHKTATVKTAAHQSNKAQTVATHQTASHKNGKTTTFAWDNVTYK